MFSFKIAATRIIALVTTCRSNILTKRCIVVTVTRGEIMQEIWEKAKINAKTVEDKYVQVLKEKGVSDKWIIPLTSLRQLICSST